MATTYPDWRKAVLKTARAVCNGSLVEKKELLGASRRTRPSPRTGPSRSRRNWPCSSGASSTITRRRSGLGAFDDVLPFSQVQILEESKTYVQKNICGGDLDITIVDLDATQDAPGPDKKKANASPGKVALHVFAAEAGVLGVGNGSRCRPIMRETRFEQAQSHHGEHRRGLCAF